MKTTFKKIAAFTAATLITAALAVPVFAEYDANNTPWFVGTGLDADTDPYFVKTLTIYNDNNSNVYVPAVKYTYTVAPATVSVGDKAPTVKDKDGLTATVQAGPEGGFLLKGSDGKGTDEYVFQFKDKDKAVELEDTKAVVSDKIYVVFDAEKFTGGAGVYRYVVTETESDYADYGISRAEGDIVRYVDVYVEEGDDGKPEVYGTVMFYSDGPNANIDIATNKTDGFSQNGNNTGEGTGEDFEAEKKKEVDPDAYKGDELYTYDYTVEKIFKNDMIVGNTLPFVVTVTNTDTNKAVQYFNYSKVSADSAANAIAAANDATNGTKGTVDTADTTVKLGDEKYLAVTGIPANCLITVTETNDKDAIYDVTVEDSIAGKIIKDTDNISIGKSDSASIGGTAPIAISDYDGDDSKLAANLENTIFTNTMKSISPTGLLFTVAPFAAMAGLGAGMIVLFSKNKKRDDAENII